MQRHYFDTAQRMRWLNTVHGVPSGMKAAVLWGEENSPDRIEAWDELLPPLNKAPTYSWSKADGPKPDMSYDEMRAALVAYAVVFTQAEGNGTKMVRIGNSGRKMDQTRDFTGKTWRTVVGKIIRTYVTGETK